MLQMVFSLPAAEAENERRFTNMESGSEPDDQKTIL
jgi:hypothetical protein